MSVMPKKNESKPNERIVARSSMVSQILPRLRFPLDFDYIHASRYGTATRGSKIEWRVTPSESV